MTTSGAAKRKAAVAENYYNIMVAAAQTSSSCLTNIEQARGKYLVWEEFVEIHVVQGSLSNVDFSILSTSETLMTPCWMCDGMYAGCAAHVPYAPLVAV